MNVLFFCPSAEKANTEQVLSIMQEAALTIGQQINVDAVNENDPLLDLGNKNYDAVVVIYTPNVELSKTIFEIVRYVDRNQPPGRFFFFPFVDDKKAIPPSFHPIRHQQHRLFFYSISGQSPQHLEAQLAQFEKAWIKFIVPSLVDQVENKESGSKRVPFGPILLFSIIIITLVGLFSAVIPPARKYLISLTPTQIHPPTATVFWMQESFQNIDSITKWQVQHYYSGQQPIQVNLPGDTLRLSAEPVVTNAVYQLDSLQKWPLDEFQSLSFSFALSAMDDQAAKNALVFGLYLSEDNSYRLDCFIVSAKTEGEIQCQVQSPVQAEALSEVIPLTLDVEHIATLVFDPHTFVVRFFLDDAFYGEREIQSVEYWRARDFNLQVRNQVQNLNAGSFSCELDSLSLTHQP